MYQNWTYRFGTNNQNSWLGNTNQNLDSKYSVIDSYIIELVLNVVNGESMDENRTCFLASIGIFICSLKQHPKKKSVKITSKN